VTAMPTVTNTTDEKIVVRTGKDHTDFRFYCIKPDNPLEVSVREARKIAKRVKETKTEGIKVSKFLNNPLKKKQESKEPEVSTEVVATEKADEEKGWLGRK